jgi:hypothetical protein
MPDGTGNATLEPLGSPVIVTSQRSGLPELRRPDAVQTLIVTPAPAPDMTSQAALPAQPKSAPDALAKIGSAALAARAKAPHKDKRTQNGLYVGIDFDRGETIRQR